MNKLEKVFLISISILLLSTIIISIPWRYQHDAPILLYISFLINHYDFIPYQNTFDMNMPGTYFIYSLIGQMFGYTDIGIRIADLLILAIMVAVNWLWMRKINWKVAWAGSVIWGLVYLGLGPSISLQREYLILLPLLIGIYFFLSEPPNLFLKRLVAGFSFGIAITIKPQSAIGLPFLLLVDFLYSSYNQDIIRVRIGRFLQQTFLPVIVGFSLPVLIVLVYFGMNGNMNNFLDMVINYLPLYTNLDGGHTTSFGFSKIKNLLLNFRTFGGFVGWSATVTIGGYIALFQTKLAANQKKQIISLLVLTSCYGIYPVFSGQFWQYHYLIFLFFVTQTSALCIVEQPGAGKSQKMFPVFALIVIFFLMMPQTAYIDFLTERQVRGSLHPKNGQVDQIVAFLKPRLRSEDTVQPLDWTCGAVHAMLILRAKIATPYIYDFYFYHNVSIEYIQRLRDKFVMDLQEARPRFIIDMYGECKPWVNGLDTTRQFDELHPILDRDYVVVFNGNDYRILEFRDTQNHVFLP